MEMAQPKAQISLRPCSLPLSEVRGSFNLQSQAPRATPPAGPGFPVRPQGSCRDRQRALALGALATAAPVFPNVLPRPDKGSVLLFPARQVRFPVPRELSTKPAPHVFGLCHTGSWAPVSALAVVGGLGSRCYSDAASKPTTRRPAAGPQSWMLRLAALRVAGAWTQARPSGAPSTWRCALRPSSAASPGAGRQPAGRRGRTARGKDSSASHCPGGHGLQVDVRVSCGAVNLEGLPAPAHRPGVTAQTCCDHTNSEKLLCLRRSHTRAPSGGGLNPGLQNPGW